MTMTPEEVIKRLAEVAQAVAFQSGTGAMETAGMFVSVLAAHPEKVAGFLDGSLSIVDDGHLLNAHCGCLSWHANNGQIVTPAGFQTNAGTAEICGLHLRM